MSSEKIKRKIRISRGNAVYIIAVALMLALCIAAYLSVRNTEFCDWWKLNVFKPYTDLVSGITSGSDSLWGLNIALVLLLYLAVVLVIAFLGIWLKTDSFQRLRNGCLKSLLVVFLLILFMYETIWYIPRNSTFLNGAYTLETQVTGEELLQLYRYLSREMSECEPEINEHGVTIRPDHEILLEAIKRSAGNLSKEFPYLKGELPDAKNDTKVSYYTYIDALIHSKGISSFSLPLTGEMYMYDSFMNDCIDVCAYAHALAHHKGYFRESEAEFISYKICTESDEPYVRYSALKSAYDLVDYELSLRGYLMGGLYSSRPFSGPMKDMYGDNPDYLEEFGWKMEKKISGDKVYDELLSLMIEDYRRNKAK